MLTAQFLSECAMFMQTSMPSIIVVISTIIVVLAIRRYSIYSICKRFTFQTKQSFACMFHCRSTPLEIPDQMAGDVPRNDDPFNAGDNLEPKPEHELQEIFEGIETADECNELTTENKYEILECLDYHYERKFEAFPGQRRIALMKLGNIFENTIFLMIFVILVFHLVADEEVEQSRVVELTWWQMIMEKAKAFGRSLLRKIGHFPESLVY